MEESFEGRVKRLFGANLFGKVPSSSFPDSSWSVAAGEVERQQWNRASGDEDAGEDDGPAYAGDRADIPCSSAFYEPDGCFAKKNRRRNPRSDEDEIAAGADELDDDDNREGGEGEGEEEIEVRSSIGLDPTLDAEEEEDENDRAAFGIDQAKDRVYMSEVMDHGPHISIHSVIPEIFDDQAPDFNRDPRADRSAAMKRLKEDTTKITQRKINEKDNNNTNLKPILKRKESPNTEKPKKRVRFGSDAKEEDSNEHQVPAPQPMDTPGVPDYIKNPSKYTKYTFEPSDSNDEATNMKAFREFQALMNKPEEVDFELPASVPFNPRRKLMGDSDAMDVGPVESERGAVSSLCYAEDENGSCEMEEDGKEEVEESVRFFKKKSVRKFRSKGDGEE